MKQKAGRFETLDSLVARVAIAVDNLAGLACYSLPIRTKNSDYIGDNVSPSYTTSTATRSSSLTNKDALVLPSESPNSYRIPSLSLNRFPPPSRDSASSTMDIRYREIGFLENSLQVGLKNSGNRWLDLIGYCRCLRCSNNSSGIGHLRVGLASCEL